MAVTKVVLKADTWGEGITPATKIAGLPAIMRSILTLKWAGVKQVAIIAGDYQELIERVLSKRDHQVIVQYDDASHDGPVIDGAALYLREELAQELAAGEVTKASLYVRYETRADVKKAEKLLWSQLRKPIENDGVVAYYFGRPISRLFSGFLISLPLTPNHVTILSFISALIGAMFVSWPGTILVGAALYWFSFVLDCVDGEVARLKFMGSVLGQWLDTVADDLATTFFSAGLGVVLYRMTGSMLYLYLGLGGAALYFVCSLLVYRVLNMTGVIDTAQYPYFFMGEGGAASEEKGLFTYLAYLFRRDVVLFIHLILAIFALYKAMFWLQVGLNIGMNLITLLDQAYRLITGNWPRRVPR